MAIQHSNNSSSIGDLLERILDKGVVIAGDIKISLADVELLNIKIRLLVASVDKAKEMGIDWWQHDPYLSSKARTKVIDGKTESFEMEAIAVQDTSVNPQIVEVIEPAREVKDPKEFREDRSIIRNRPRGF